jgi:DNA-binding response OmpR family regulator
MQILVVEDEKKIACFLRRGLLEEHYAVDLAHDGEEALYKSEINEYDCIILDIMLPKVDGLTVCKKIRARNQNVPILLLTARDQVEDKIAGLDAGADDYVSKPFSFEELLARIRALIRRGNKVDPVILSIDTLTLDPATKTAERNGKQLNLTAREYSLLEYFMRNQNRVLTKTQLLEHVWDYNYDGFSNIVETYVKYVRRKIKTSPADAELIHTRRGTGYIMRKEPQ